MAQIAKLEVQTELKANADKFYELFQSKGYLLPKICPEVIKGLKVVKGDWGSVGSIKEWTYCAAGNVSEVSTETIVAIDEKNKSITHQLVEGELQKYYKSFSSTLQVTPKQDGGSSMKWSIKYEKQNESIPAPNKYLDFVVNLSNSIDAYLIKNA